MKPTRVKVRKSKKNCYIQWHRHVVKNLSGWHEEPSEKWKSKLNKLDFSSNYIQWKHSLVTSYITRILLLILKSKLKRMNFFFKSKNIQIKYTLTLYSLNKLNFSLMKFTLLLNQVVNVCANGQILNLTMETSWELSKLIHRKGLKSTWATKSDPLGPCWGMKCFAIFGTLAGRIWHSSQQLIHSACKVPFKLC